MTSGASDSEERSATLEVGNKDADLRPKGAEEARDMVAREGEGAVDVGEGSGSGVGWGAAVKADDLVKPDP